VIKSKNKDKNREKFENNGFIIFKGNTEYLNYFIKENG